MDLDTLEALLTLLNEQNVVEFSHGEMHVKLNADYTGSPLAEYEIPFLGADSNDLNE